MVVYALLKVVWNDISIYTKLTKKIFSFEEARHKKAKFDLLQIFQYQNLWEMKSQKQSTKISFETWCIQIMAFNNSDKSSYWLLAMGIIPENMLFCSRIIFFIHILRVGEFFFLDSNLIAYAWKSFALNFFFLLLFDTLSNHT